MDGSEGGDDGEGQDSYLAPTVPETYVNPPGETAFANATWMHAGPEVRKLVADVMAYEEFSDLQGMQYSVVWRRKTAPMKGDDPIFATVEITKARVIWEANQMEVPNFPRFFVDLCWQHFNTLRNGGTPGEREDPDGNPETRGAQYVHNGILQQHVHHALSSLSVTNDILGKRAPDFTGWATTVKRFGLWTGGLLVVRRQMSLWPDPDE